MCPSLIEIGSKTAEKNCTNKQTDTTKIMVTWPWTKKCNQLPWKMRQYPVV